MHSPKVIKSKQPVAADVRRRNRFQAGNIRLPTNGGQSGIGLPHSTTSRTEWHARISRQRRGVRQPYAAFIASTLADFPFVGIMPLVFGVWVLLTSAATFRMDYPGKA
jgi:hypothetical protein